jgi:hypothetical protein
MGYYVHIHVCFACDTNEGVAALALKHKAMLSDSNDGAREAGWFLADLVKRTGHNPGPKGGLSTWGIVGNYTRGEAFVKTLMPFWLELLSGDIDGGPCSFEHILVFEEPEQTERTIAYEIFLEDRDDPKTLEVKRHECPFSFMQM